MVKIYGKQANYVQYLKVCMGLFYSPHSYFPILNCTSICCVLQLRPSLPCLMTSTLHLFCFEYWLLFEYFSKYFQNFCRDEELYMVNFSFQCVPETEKFDSLSSVPNTISIRVFRLLEILFSRIICVLCFFNVEWS